MSKTMRLPVVVLALALTIGAMGVAAADPTTIGSSTMVFEGALTDDGDGTYSGTIAMIDETGMGVGDGIAGFDVYARDGEMATYDKAGSGSQDYACGAVSNHDAYTTGGGWGTYYDPDCADWYNYQLRIDGDDWYVEYESGGVAYAPPMSGLIDWAMMYAAETGAGAYYAGMGTPESAGYALNNGCTGVNDGAQAWDMDWSWGSEYIPLELPGFDLVVEDLGGGNYRVTMSPGDPPNTVASGTMIFRGALTDLGGGEYEGTLPMVDEEALGVGDGIAGYDVYARNGSPATWKDGVYVCGPVDNHDAYTSGGGWGTYYDPDCADWYNYQLRLEAGMWYVEYNGNVGNDGILTGAACAPLSGEVDWGDAYAAETGVGAYYPSMGTSADPGYALNNPCTGVNTGAASWDMDWSWGSDYVPLSYPGFDVTVDDLGGGQYQVTLTPAADGDPPGPIVNQTTGESYGSIQAAADEASYGDVIVLTASGTCYDGGVIVNTPGVMIIGEPGACVTFGSPAFTVTAADVTIQGLDIDGSGGGGGAGILLQAGGDNCSILDCNIHDWSMGVQIASDLTSYKMVGNWVHDNGLGMWVMSVTLDGVVTIEGNLFKENTGGAVDSVMGAELDMRYNSWGVWGNPGSMIYGWVAYDPWTYAEPFMDMQPTDPEDAAVEVAEGDVFEVQLKIDCRELVGLQFLLTYDIDFLELQSWTWHNNFGDHAKDLEPAPVDGQEYYSTWLEAPLTGEGQEVLTLEFLAKDDGTHAGEIGHWYQFFDLSHLEAETNAGAPGGVKIWIDNAGFGDPSDPGRDITDTDDGHVVIHGVANYAGFVDLQGRTDDSGATVSVSQTLMLKATGVTASDGSYTTAHEPGENLVIDRLYDISVEAPLFLPAKRTGENLGERPLTDLPQVKLLGGDAVDDDVIDIGDVSLIGSNYGMTSGYAPNADVNIDGQVDILDLVLAAGNYTLTFSPWV